MTLNDFLELNFLKTAKGEISPGDKFVWYDFQWNVSRNYLVDHILYAPDGTRIHNPIRVVDMSYDEAAELVAKRHNYFLCKGETIHPGDKFIFRDSWRSWLFDTCHSTKFTVSTDSQVIVEKLCGVRHGEIKSPAIRVLPKVYEPKVEPKTKVEPKVEPKTNAVGCLYVLDKMRDAKGEWHLLTNPKIVYPKYTLSYPWGLGQLGRNKYIYVDVDGYRVKCWRDWKIERLHRMFSRSCSDWVCYIDKLDGVKLGKSLTYVLQGPRIDNER